jgi:hypothetical protein
VFWRHPAKCLNTVPNVFELPGNLDLPKQSELNTSDGVLAIVENPVIHQKRLVPTEEMRKQLLFAAADSVLVGPMMDDPVAA